MDVSLARLISEIETEKEDDYNFFDQFTNNINSDSFQTYTTTTTAAVDTPKLGSIGPIQISFGELDNSGPPQLSTSPTNYRIISERNRRHKLGQDFISLAALIPGLKKMDKASILSGAIEYLKQSQERVKSLEERMNHYHKNSRLHEENSTEKDGLEINARISGRNILINIYYKKFRGFEAMLLMEMARFRLVIVNTNFLSFGLSHVEATIITQMESEFNMSVEDLVTTLQLSISSFIERRCE